ncbi:MAG TPA: hypothetical protein VI454_21125 [Verrucomicrobiae bacterium]
MNNPLAAAVTTVAANSSATSNGVDLIDTSGFTDPDTITVANRINEMPTAQRR